MAGVVAARRRRSPARDAPGCRADRRPGCARVRLARDQADGVPVDVGEADRPRAGVTRIADGGAARDQLVECGLHPGRRCGGRGGGGTAPCPTSGGSRPEAVGRLDDAELVPLGVGEHDVGVVGVLSDLDVAPAERRQLGHRALLVVERRGREVDVDPVLAELLVRGLPEQQAEARLLGHASTSHPWPPDVLQPVDDGDGEEDDGQGVPPWPDRVGGGT